MLQEIIFIVGFIEEGTNLWFCGSLSMCRGQEQRERTKQMTLKDICQLFDLPIEQAAKEMKVCVTVLKKICRKGSLRRWPHRKVIESKHYKQVSLF